VVLFQINGLLGFISSQSGIQSQSESELNGFVHISNSFQSDNQSQSESKLHQFLLHEESGLLASFLSYGGVYISSK